MATNLSWSRTDGRHGLPVVYFHGTPAAKGRIPYPDVVARAGVPVLCAQRPGYGDMPAQRELTLLDVARMVCADLAALGIDRFSVLGWSGGGPHALACAAYASARVDAVGLIASWAPMQPPDAGLPVNVRLAMRAARFVPRAALRGMLLTTGSTAEGLTDDVRRVARPWGFGVEDVARVTRVIAWHSQQDREVPINPWRSLKNVELREVPGGAHECSADTWAEALTVVGGATPAT